MKHWERVQFFQSFFLKLDKRFMAENLREKYKNEEIKYPKKNDRLKQVN